MTLLCLLNTLAPNQKTTIMSEFLNEMLANMTRWDNKKSDFNYLISEMFEQKIGFDFKLNGRSISRR